MNIKMLLEDNEGLGEPVRHYLEKTLPHSDVLVVSLFDSINVGIDQLIEKLKIRNFDRIIFHCSHHSFYRFTEYYARLCEVFGPGRVIAITGNGIYHGSTESNLVYFPYYWYNGLPGPQKEEFIDPWIFDQDLIVKFRQYPASCLNNRYSMHRLLLFDMIYQRDYFNQVIYSLNEIIDENKLPLGEVEFNLISNIKFRYKGIIPLFLDRSSSCWGPDLLGINHPANTESYLNIVTENSWDEPFVSEKTFKPIACGQFFLLLSGSGTVELVRKLGFDVFDDYFDHSYDQELDLNTRVQMVVENLDRWMGMNHEKIWSETLHRRMSNARRFFDLDLTNNPFNSII